MKLKPGQRAVLRDNDGRKFTAKPFFYADHMGEGVRVQLFLETGVPLKCIDEATGTYSAGESGMTLYLVSPSSTTETNGQVR